jgi:hypothetical protein
VAHSEKKNPWFSKSYVQHYDDSGNKTGKSFDKTNPITNKTKTVHTDQNNSKIGSSENIKDSFTGKTHRQHYDQDGTPTSYTERKKNFFGKYKSYTKSGKKRTTQEYLAAIILIGLAIYFVIKVILPLAFVLATPVITIIALVNIIKSKDETYFKYSLICSALFIIDYLFNGYSSYLMADESFVSENLYIYVGIAFVCFGLSIILLFYNQLNQILLKFNIENINGRKSIVVLLFLILLTPFYFIENKFLTRKKTNFPSENNTSKNISINSKESIDNLNYRVTIQSNYEVLAGCLIKVADQDFPEPMSYAEAILACSKLGDGWRLPDEEETIEIRKQLYKNSQSVFSEDKYWCNKSTNMAQRADGQKYFSFSDGQIRETNDNNSVISESSKLHVRLVKTISCK